MPKNKVTLFLVFAMVAGISAAAFLVASRGEAQSQPNSNRIEAKVLRKGNSSDSGLSKKELDDAATPIVDYDAPKSTDDERIAKNARYDGRGGFSAIASTFKSPESTIFPHGMLDLPIAESDLIVEGDVTDSAAYLSNDKGSVYSEFTVRITDVLKINDGIKVGKNDAIITERYGARVRYSDGRITRFTVLGHGSPMKAKKYLLFLTKGELGNYRILTGYESRGNKVFPLDGPQLTRQPESASVFDKHSGKDYKRFKDEVEKAKNDPENSNENRRDWGP